MADIEGVSEYVPLTETPSPELAPTPSEDPSLAQTTPQEEAPETAPPPAPAPEPTAIESPMVQLNEPDAPKPQVAPAQEPAAIAVGNAVTEPVDSANPGDTVAVESKSTPPPEAAVVTASAVGDPQVMSSQSATVTKTPDDAPAGTAVTTASVVTQQSAVTDLQNTTQNSIRTSAVIGLDVSQSSAAITDTSPTVPNSAANVSAVTVTKNASTTNDATNGATTDTKPGVGVAADAPVGALTAMVGVPNVAALKVESTTGGLTAFQSTTMANSAPGGFLTPEAKARAVTQPSAGVNTAPLASTLGNSAGSVLKLTATQTGPQTGTQTATPIPPLNSAASAAGVTAPATWANFDGKVPIDAVAGLPGAMLGTKIFDNAAATKVPTGTSTSTLSSVSTNGTSSVTKQATDTNLSTGVTTAPISTTLNSGASVAGKPFQSLFSPTALVGGLANPAAPGTPAAPALSGTLQSILGQTNAKGSPQTAASEWKSSPFALPSSKFEQAVTAQAAKDAAAGKPVDAAIPRSLGDATAAAPALGATPSVEVAGPKQVVDLRNLTTMKPFVGPEQQPYGPVPMPEMGGKPTGVPMPDFSGTNTGIPMPGMTTLPDLKGDATPRPFLGIGGAPDKGGAVPMPFMGLGEIAGKPVQGPVPALSTTPTNVAGAAVPAKNALTQNQIDTAIANGAVLGKDIPLPLPQLGNGNPTLTASDINGIKNSGDQGAAMDAALAGKSAQSQTSSLGAAIDRNSVASSNLIGNPSTTEFKGAASLAAGASAQANGLSAADGLVAMNPAKQKAPSNQPAGPLADQPPRPLVPNQGFGRELRDFGDQRAADAVRANEKRELRNAASAWVTNLQNEAASNPIFGGPTYANKSSGPLDNNRNFVAASASVIPMYRSTREGLTETYIIPTEASKMVAATNVDGGKASAKTPNPKAQEKDQAQWWKDAASGKIAGVKDGGDAAAMINTQFFARNGAPTNLSFASMENGVWKSTGGIQGIDLQTPANNHVPKMAMQWGGAKDSKVTIAPWAENTGPRGENGQRMQQSYDSVVDNAGLIKGNTNLLVGNTVNERSTRSEHQTLVGTNAQGKAAFLVSNNNITEARAAALLREAGYGNGVMVLDSGASSQFVAKDGNGRGNHLVVSDERRAIPSVMILKK
jgi:hypothetical protein